MNYYKLCYFSGKGWKVQNLFTKEYMSKKYMSLKKVEQQKFKLDEEEQYLNYCKTIKRIKDRRKKTKKKDDEKIEYPKGDLRHYFLK